MLSYVYLNCLKFKLITNILGYIIRLYSQTYFFVVVIIEILTHIGLHMNMSIYIKFAVFHLK